MPRRPSPARVLGVTAVAAVLLAAPAGADAGHADEKGPLPKPAPAQPQDAHADHGSGAPAPTPDPPAGPVPAPRNDAHAEHEPEPPAPAPEPEPEREEKPAGHVHGGHSGTPGAKEADRPRGAVLGGFAAVNTALLAAAAVLRRRDARARERVRARRSAEAGGTA